MQMLPEIAHADETVKTSNMRDVLAITPRGCVAEVRANGATTGTALWEGPHNKNPDSAKPAETRAPALKPGVSVRNPGNSRNFRVSV